MKTLISIAILFSLTGIGQSNPIHDILKKKDQTLEEINSIKESDIPRIWKSSKAIKDQGDVKIIQFKRNNEDRLFVSWLTQSRTEGSFAAGITDKGKTVSRIHFGKHGVSISYPHLLEPYHRSTLITKEGKTRVLIWNDKGFLEIVEIDGRKTRLISDLEYTKEALKMLKLVQPMKKALESYFSELQTKKKDE